MEELGLRMSTLTDLIRRRYLGDALRTDRLTGVCERADTYSLRARIRIGRIMLLRRVPITRDIYTRIELFTTFLCGCVIYHVLAFEGLLTEGIESFRRLINRVILDLLRSLFRDLNVDLRRDCLDLDTLDFLFLTFLRRNAGLLNGLIDLLLIIVRLLLDFAAGLIMLRGFLCYLADV